MAISTGIALTLIPFAPGFENRSYNVLFNADSDNTTSHIITVDENPFVIEAFGLVDTEQVEVWQVGGTGVGQYFNPLYVRGTKAVLSATNTKLVIDVSGRYEFRLVNGGLGTVFVAGHDANVASELMGLGKLAT